MLQEFIDRGGDYQMPMDEARTYDQRPFRSMLMRGWVAYSTRRRSFHLTRDGWDAWEIFQQTDIRRKHPERPITSYFDMLVGSIKPRQARTAHAAAA